MQLINFNSCPLSNRHGSYGGLAGDKDGILFNNEYWIIKYPKSTKNFKNSETLDPYTTAPLSEYIGSHIYEALGYNTHQTLLGVRNNKLVVACKDFCKTRGQLMEIRTIKNAAYRELSEKLETELHGSATGDLVNLEELLLHLEYNPLLKNTPHTTERFWETAIIDIFIENNDRNNGNWGLLYNEEENIYTLAPVFDNGNSFMNKASESQIQAFLENPDKLATSALGARTSFEYNEHILSAKKLLRLDIVELEDALLKVYPLIKEHFSDIEKIIQEIPEKVGDIEVCSKNRKQCYLECLRLRLEQLLLPAYNRVLEKRKPLFKKEDDDFNIDFCPRPTLGR